MPRKEGVPSDESEPMPPPPPCISYAKIPNQHGPYANRSWDKAVASAYHIRGGLVQERGM